MTWIVREAGPIIELIPDGSNNFIWEDYFPSLPDGIPIQSIQVYFSAPADKLDMRTHGISGPRMFKYTTISGESMAKRFYGGTFKPTIVHSEQVYTTPANWLITIQKVSL